VIQAAMGWLDHHLWEFVVEERKYGMPDPDRAHVKNGATTKLATFLSPGMTDFDYVTILATTGHIGSSSNKPVKPRPAKSISVNVDAHLKTVLVHLATLISSRTLPASKA
jgi:hypothetical protein